jgi:DNA (cytosine-5)-methyltransferase 1
MKRKNSEIDLSSKKLRPNKIWQFVDLFCGIGGFHQGILDALGANNAECVFACDIDNTCQEVYMNNHKVVNTRFLCDDILNISSISSVIPDHDILCAGIPCQSFSCAGKRDGIVNTKVAAILDQVCCILLAKIPEFFIIENVPQFLKKAWSQMKCILGSRWNYTIIECNVNNFGLPQNRKRVFIVGSRNYVFKWSQPYYPNVSMRNMGLDHVDSRSTEWLDKKEYTILPHDSHPDMSSPTKMIFCGYINTSKSSNKGSRNLLCRYHGQSNRIYNINGCMCSLRHSEMYGRYYIYTESGVRKLSVDECYRCMGWDPDFARHELSKVALKQIGNAVCPRIISEIVRQLMDQYMEMTEYQ